MLNTVTCVLAVLALLTSVWSLSGKCPAGVPAFLLSVAVLLRCLPVGH